MIGGKQRGPQQSRHGVKIAWIQKASEWTDVDRLERYEWQAGWQVQIRASKTQS